MSYEGFIELNKKNKLKGGKKGITINKVLFSKSLVIDIYGNGNKIEDLIKLVVDEKVFFTNPSKLKNWSGFKVTKYFSEPRQEEKKAPFEIVKRTSKQVILKVFTEDNFVVAQYPYLSGTMDYITLEYIDDSYPGLKQYMMSILHKNGKSFKFVWGGSATTLISEPLKQLRNAVINFLKENSVYLGGNREYK